MRSHFLTASCAAAFMLTLPGCFLSGDGETFECTAAPVCPSGRVPGCTPGTPECEAVTLCGETLYCAPVTTQCGALPICAPEEVEVPRCEGGASCHPVEMCGATIFCDVCDVEDVCEGDILRMEQCDDEGPPCRIVEACGRQHVCQEQAPECDIAVGCPPNSIEVGICEVDEPGCIFLSTCGEDIYCIPAGECPGGEQVIGPEDCLPESTCYFEDIGDARIWCTGGGAECFAFPVCMEGEIALQLLEPCPEDAFCRYETTCGQTIQCAQPGTVDGK